MLPTIKPIKSPATNAPIIWYSLRFYALVATLTAVHICDNDSAYIQKPLSMRDRATAL